MKPRRRRRLAALGTILVLAGALLLGLFPQEPLRRLAEARLRQGFGQARLARLHVVPLKLSLEVEGLELETSSFHLVVERARVSFEPRLPGLDAIALRELDLTRPRLTLRSIDAQPDTSRAPEATTPAQRLPILSIGTVSLSDGSLAFESARFPISLSGIGATGALGPEPLRLEALRGRIGGEQALELGPLSAVLRADADGNLALEASSVRLGEASRGSSSGTLLRRRVPAPDLRFEATLQLEDLAPLGLPEGTTGRVSVEGRAALAADGTPAASARADGEGLSLARLPVERLSLEAGYGRDVGQAVVRLSALAGRAEIRARLAQDRLEGKASVDELALERVAALSGGTSHELAGRLSAEARFRGPSTGPWSLDGRWTARGSLPGVPAWSSEGTTAGSIGLPSDGYDLRWESTLAADWPTGTDGFSLRALHATSNGRARSGAASQLEARLQGETLLRTLAAEAPLSFQADASASGPARHVSASAAWGSSRAELRSRLSGETLDEATLRLVDFDLARLAPTLVGTLEGEASAKGPLRQPEIRVSARGEGVAISGVPVGAVAGRLEGTPDQSRFELSAAELPLQAEGSLSLGPPREARAHVVLDQASLARLRSLWPERDLEGELSAQLDVTLPLDHPDRPAAEGQITALRARSGEVELHAARPIAVRVEGSRVSMEDLELVGDGVQLSGAASLDSAPSPPLVEGDTRARLDIGRLPLPESWRASGTAALDLAFAGPLTRPQLHGTLALVDLHVASSQLPELGLPEAQLRFAGDSLEIDSLRAGVAGGELTLSAQVPFASVLKPGRHEGAALAPEERARLDLRWADIDAAALLAATGSAQATVEARLQGEAHLEGGLTSLEELEARLATPRLTGRVNDLDLTLTPIELRLANGLARLEPVRIETTAGALSVEGSADLVRSEIDLVSRGRVELRALSPFMGEASATGIGVLDLSLAGRFDALRPRGSLRVEDATLRLRLLRDALTSIRGAVTFEGDTLRVQELSGRFGGGSVELSGGADVAGSTLRDVALQITGRGVGLRYPAGLRSRLDADLGLAGDWGSLSLAGVARVQRGLYDLDLAFGETLGAAAVSSEPSPLLQSIGLDVRVTLENPIAVRNSLADLRVDGSLDFRGDMNEPVPFGRLEIRPGGKVSLQQRAFEIESGRLVYDGTWDPGLDIRGRAGITGTDPLGRRNDYRVTASASGTLERPALSFDSSPALSENEIVSLIATGQTGAQALSAGAALAGEQAAALLTGQLTRGLSEGLRELGLDEVQIQPEIVARELTPGARFTFRKQLQKQSSLTYSLSLKYPEQRFLQLDVKPGLGITAFGQQRDDGTSSVGFGQRFRWGAGTASGPAAPAPEAEPVTRLSNVRLEGVPADVDEGWLARRIRARAGRRVTQWELQEDADRLREALRERDYLEAEASARLADDTAVFELHPGPRYAYRVEGASAPPGFERQLRSALYEDEARDKGAALLVRELARQGYATARVDSDVRDEAGRRVVVFRARSGTRFSTVRWSFPGAAALSEAELRRAAGDVAEVLAAPGAAVTRIRQAYAARHYLAADAGPVEVSRSESTLAIRIPVRDGPHAEVGEVRVDGVPEVAGELLELAALRPGAWYDEAATAAAALRVRDQLLSQGYPWARVVVETRPDPPDIDVVLRVDRGRAVRIAAIEIEGLRATRESLVRARLPFRVGEPLDPRSLQRAERELLALGTFARVAINFSPEEQSTLRVELVEDARLVASYDLRYNEEEKGQALVDVEARNLFGSAAVFGVRQGVSADVLQTRASLSLPSLLGRGSFTASGFRIEEDIGGELGGTSLQRGAEIQRAQPLPGRFTLLAGYRFKRVSVADFEPVDVAGLDLTLYRDTRDSVLDARRGAFLSLNLQVSPKKIGSDFDFLKGYLQAFFTTGIGAGLTWAHGYRLGVSHVYGGEPLVSSERFRAGGANSVRGYETDSLGPLGFLGDPAGGQAVLVFNQELRYRHRSGLGAAAFWDAGNVFAKTTDLGFELQHALGLGLRYDSPVGLLRLDVGFPLGRREGDKSYRLHFSLGQAF